MIIKKIFLLRFNNSVLYLLPYYTQIKSMYRNMYLNSCIKHTKKNQVTNGLLKPGRKPAFERCSLHLWVNENKVSRVPYCI